MFVSKERREQLIGFRQDLRSIRQFETACRLRERAGDESVEGFNPRSCALLGRDGLTLYESLDRLLHFGATMFRDKSVGKSIGGTSP